MIQDFLLLATILFVYMSVWFGVSIFRKRNDVADVAWGLGFVLMAWVSFLIGRDMNHVGLLTTLLVTVWGLRLAWHIHTRNAGKTEDYRYQQWRESWGKWFYPRSYVQVYLLQGFFLYLVVSPVLVINLYGVGVFGALGVVGICLWMIGFFFESVSDWQLARFIQDSANRGRLMITGLWAYTRHPNYFGEVTQWWGIWLIALGASLGWVSVIGPLTITWLILAVSGIPMLEKKMAEHPDFAEYKRRVSIFLPLPPQQ